jgi:hypothetical protein
MDRRAIAAFLAAILLLPGMVNAQNEQEPSWMAPLRKQLMQEENCALIYTTSMQELPLAGRISLSGRAHCEDGRSFDVERNSVDQPFTFRACEPVAC